MNQQMFTLREARYECLKRGFKKSRIWWNIMASKGKFSGVKVKINGRTCWAFTVDEVNRIASERPRLPPKILAIALALSMLFAGHAFAEVGLASWYSTVDACGAKTNNHPGCPTASGRGLFDLERDGVLFCASNDYPIGTKLKVTNNANNKSVVCLVLDRGGFKKYGRVIDLGKLAFDTISHHRNGVISVTINEVVA